MAIYGNRYVFEFLSQNGDEVEIHIQKKGHIGNPTYRSLGRGPVLKRERNDAIMGTSLEIYAECRVDGEFAELYTSSADEFRAVVYKNRQLQWIGYVSPELYAEPDIAPPYDVQIIATDGLGELKNADFKRYNQSYSLKEHLEYILAKTGLSLDIQLVSSLSWDDNTSDNYPYSLLELYANISHMNDKACYDVLQDMLAALGAIITQQDGRWMIVRETDVYDNISAFSIAQFGSANKTLWWPIGNMSTDIIPAKNKITLTQENTYKENTLPPLVSGVAGGWELSPGVYYENNEGAYILNNEAYVQHTKEYPMYPIQTPLFLTISARPLARANVEGEARLYYTIMMQGSLDGVYGTYYLAHTYDDTLDKMVWIWHPDSFLGQYTWRDVQPQQTGDPEITYVEIEIPSSSNATIDKLTITVGNMPILSKFPIALYDIVLTQAGQIRGLQLVANISNNARESMNEKDVILSSSSDPMLPETMYGVLRLDGGITSWHTPYNRASTLLRFLARDYAMLIALPRMRYRGKLNVPASPSFRIPFLFERDNTYYQLNTYSYDLLNDELYAELISIPNARVVIDSETVTELPSSNVNAGPSSGSGSGGGTGGGSAEGGGASSLSQLDDVALTGLTNDQALVWENGYWRNKSVEGGTIEVDSSLSTTSTNPVQNKVVTAALNNKVGRYGDEGRAYAQADGLIDSDDTHYYLPNINPEDKSHTFAMLSDIPESGGSITIDTELSDISENAIANKTVTSALKDKQNTIEDLDAIRSGASKGATSIQKVKTINEEPIEGEGNLSLVVSDDGLARCNGFIDVEDFKYFFPSERNSSEAETLATIEIVNNGLSTKQDIIEDIEGIRSGAAKGATAVQPESLAKVAISGSYNDLSNKPSIPIIPDNIYVKPSAGIPKSDLESSVQSSLDKADTAIQKVKTINGQSIVGEGNLVIEEGGGGGTSGDPSDLLTQISIQLDAVESLLDELNDSEIPLIDTINEINGEVI